MVALSVNVILLMILMSYSGSVECVYDVYNDFDEL